MYYVFRLSQHDHVDFIVIYIGKYLSFGKYLKRVQCVHLCVCSLSILYYIAASKGKLLGILGLDNLCE